MQSEEKSEFNYAVEFLRSMRVLFNNSVEAMMSLDAHRWFQTLMAIAMELWDDMSDEQKTILKERIDNLGNKVAVNTNRVMTKGMNSIPRDLFNELYFFEGWLRDIFKAAGYKTKYREDLYKPKSEWSDDGSKK